MRRQSSCRIAFLGLVVVSVLTACGGAGSSGAIDRPSITASFSPTRTPSSRSEPTRSPDRTDTAPRPSSQAPEPSSEPAAPSPSAASTPTSTSPAEQTSISGWWWLLIPVLVVAAVIGLLLQRRSRSRRTWRAQLASAEREVGWFARDLVPQLRGTGSAAGVAGGWSVATPRVTSLEDHLSRVVATAPGDQERARAVALQTAVRTARDRVAAVVAAGEASAQWSLDLDEAQAPLLAVLVPPDKEPAGGEARH